MSEIVPRIIKRLVSGRDNAWSRRPFVPACARCGGPFPEDARQCPNCQDRLPVQALSIPGGQP